MILGSHYCYLFLRTRKKIELTDFNEEKNGAKKKMLMRKICLKINHVMAFNVCD